MFICSTLGLPDPKMVDEEGRSMVLRGLLARKKDELRLFRASAKLAGFCTAIESGLAGIAAQPGDPGRTARCGRADPRSIRHLL